MKNLRLSRFGRLSVVAVLCFAVVLSVLPQPALAAPTPMTTITPAPVYVFPGEEFTFDVTFTNDASPGAPNIGYGPEIVITLPTGVTFVGPTVESSTFGTLTPVSTNPLTVRLPVGSFTPTQVDDIITITAAASPTLLPDNSPLAQSITSTGSFRFGSSPTGKTPIIQNPPTSAQVIPILHLPFKDAVTRYGEYETATGPNFPISYIFGTDIADGATIYGLEFTEELPHNLQFTGITNVSLAGGGDPDIVITFTPEGGSAVELYNGLYSGLAAELPLDGPASASSNSPGGSLQVSISSAIGTTTTNEDLTDQDVVIEFDAFVPEFDVDGNAILDPDAGGSSPVENVVSVSAESATGRFAGSIDLSGNEPIETEPVIVQARAIAIQKHVETLDEPLGPGSDVRFTLNTQVSDYFTLEHIAIQDVLGDGYSYNAGSSQLTGLLENGASATGVPVTFNELNPHAIIDLSGGGYPDPLGAGELFVTPDSLPTGASVGFTTLTYDVSGLSVDGSPIGSLTGGNTSGSTADGYVSGVADETGFTITFTAEVLDEYSNPASFPGGDASIDSFDELHNNVQVSARVVGGDGTYTTDTSATEQIISEPELFKALVAQNGNPVDANGLLNVFPGDVLTFELRVDIPTGRLEVLSVTDFLPLPILDATEVDTFGEPCAAGFPAAGNACYATGTTLDLIGPSGGLAPTIATDRDENTVTFSWPDNTTFEADEDITVIVHFSVTVNTNRFHDELHLTNVAVAEYGNSVGEPGTATGIAGFVLRQPVLEITKDVTPTTADAGDTVLYTVTVENTGGHPAYDVRVLDTSVGTLPLTSCNVTSVSDGTAQITYYGNLFADPGMHIPGPIPAEGEVVINYACVVTVAISPAQAVENTVQITEFYNEDGTNPERDNFVDPGDEPEDSATFNGPNAAITKRITGTSQAFTTGNDVAIGEIVSYEVVVTIPEGTSTNVVFRDTLDQGLAFVSGSLTMVSSNPTDMPLPAPLPSTPSYTSPTSATDRVDGRVQINFGTIVNNNTNNAVAETITFTYDAVVLNNQNTGTTPPPNRTQLNNAAEWYWGSASTGGGCTPGSETCVQTFAPNVTVQEAEFSVTKEANATEADAGDTITYTITIENTGSTTAHDVVLTDVIPEGLTYVGGTPGSFQHDGTPPVPNMTSDDNPDTTGLTASWTAFPAGASTSFTYQVTVDQNLPTGEVINNKAVVTWTSLPGEVPSVTTPHGNPFACERTGPGHDPTCTGGADFNDYEATGDHDLTIFAPAFVGKSLTATSETAEGDSDPGDNNLDSNPPVQIGEELTYSIAFSFPEAVTPDAVLADVLHTTAVDGALVLVSATLQKNSVGLVLENNHGGINEAGIDTPVDVTSSMVDGTREFTLPLGDVTNTDQDADAETLTLTLTYRVANIVENHAGTILTDHGELRYGTGMIIATDSVSVHVSEPVVDVQKTATPASVVGGTTVTFQIVIRNTAAGTNAATGFNWMISDVLPDLYEDLRDASVVTAPTHANANASITGNTLNVTIDELRPGESVSVTYTADVVEDVKFGQEIDNTVDAQATSLRGPSEHERTGTGGVNDLHDSSTQTTTAGLPTISKAITPLNNPYAIGEVATFVITAGVPVGSAQNFVITDVLDEGLVYVPDSLSVSFPGASSATNEPLNDGNAAFFDYDETTNTITLTFGTLTITEAGNVIVTYGAYVENIIENQTGTRLDNSATLSFDDPNDPAGTISPPPATPQDEVVVGEPEISLTKAVVSGQVGSTAGDTVGWSVTITNTGNTTAYQLEWSDIMPAGSGSPGVNDGVYNITNPSITISGGDVFLNNTTTAPSPANLTISTTTNTNDTISLAPIQVAPGATIVIAFDTQLGPAVQPAQELVNNTTVTYASIPEDNGRERDGSDGPGDGLNNYSTTSSDEVTVGAEIAINKTVNPTTYAVGQSVTFDVVVHVIEGTTASLVVTDTLPAGLEYVSHAISFGCLGVPNADMLPGNPDYNTRLGTGQVVEFNFGDLANPPDGNSNNDCLTISITARVLNLAGNQNGTILGNHVYLTYQDANGDPQREDFDADPATPGIQPREITIVEPELEITKTVDPTEQSLGDIVTFEIDIEHLASSTATAFDLVIVDELPVGLTYVPDSVVFSNGGTIEVSGQTLTFRFASLTLADSSTTFTYRAQIDPTAAAGTPLANDALLTWTSIPEATGAEDSGRNGSDGPDGPLNNYADEDSAIVTPSTAAFIAIEKSVADITGEPDMTLSGDTLEYTIVVTNTNGPVTGVVVTDAIPIGTTYVDGSLTVTSGNGTPDDSGDPLVVNIGDMAEGESTTFTFRVVVDQFTPAGTIITNTATVDSDQTVPTSDDADRPVGKLAEPGVRAEKRVALTNDVVAPTDGTINVGDQVTYTITITNTGFTPLTGIVFTDDMPTGVTVSSVSGTVWDCDFTTGAEDTVSCEFTGTELDAGDSATIQIVATVDAAGVHVNQGTVTTNETPDTPTDGNDDPNDGEQPTEFPAEEPGVSGTPSIDVRKSVSIIRELNLFGQLNPGETIRYTITVQNTGSAPATNVTMVDNLPSFTTLVPPGVTTSQGIVTNPGIQPPPDVPAPYQVAVNLGTIPAGGLATITIDLFVHEDVPVPGEIVNQSLTDFNENPGDPVPSDDPNTDDPDDPTRIPVDTPYIFDPPSGFKTVDPTGYPVLEWQMVWINPSNDIATHTRVIDPIPADTEYVDGSLECLPGGSSMTTLCEYDETNNQVVWEGAIAPDPGATSEDDAPNAVIIRYQTTVGPNVSEVSNQACAYWDSDGDTHIGGPGGDPQELDQVPVCTDDPTSDEPGDPTFWRAPDLSITKWRDGALVVSQQGAYWLTVTNVGEGTTFNPITVTDYLPSGLEIVSATGAEWDCIYDGAQHAAVCESLTILEPGESLPPIVLVVDVTPAALPSVLNVVEVATDGDIVPENNRDENESSVVDLTTPPGEAEWDGTTDPGLLCDHQCTAGSIFFPWVGNDDDFGLGPADTSISIQNLEDRDAYIFIYRGVGDESLLADKGWELATVAYLSAYASKTFTPEMLGIEAGDGAPIGVGGYHTAITNEAGQLVLDQVSIGGYAKQASGGENLPYTSEEDDVVDGYNAFSCLEIKTFDDWYLPIVQRNVGPGGAWNTIVRVANFGGYAEDGELLTNRNAAVTVRFFPADDGSGSLQTGFQLQYHVSSGDTVNIDIADYVPEGWVGSVHIYSDGAVAAMADRYKNEGYKVWLTTTASNPGHEAEHNQTQDGSQLAPYVLFAPDVRLNYFGWNTGINVANLVNEYNNVTIQYFNQFGNAPATLTQRLGPQGMTYFYNPSLEGQNISTQDPRTDVNSSVVGSALIWSDHPIAVAVDSTKYPESDPTATFGQIQGITYNATANVYPWQAVPLVQKGNPATGMGATSGINIMNPNNVANQVTVHWFNPSGNSADNFGTSTLAIPAYANGFVYTLAQHNLPNGFYGSAVVTSIFPVAATSAQVDYEVGWDGAVIWNAYNPGGFYRVSGCYHFGPVFDQPFGGAIQAEVVDDEGEPIVGVGVMIYNDAAYEQIILGNSNNLGIAWTGTGVSDLNGEINWLNMPEGDYWIVVTSVPLTLDNLDLYSGRGSIHGPHRLNGGQDIVIPIELTRRPLP